MEGRGHRQVAPLEGKTANTPRLGPVSTSRQRIAELARQALGMAVAIAWLPGPAGTRRRVAKLSVEEPDAAEPARPDLWGARVSNDPGLPDHGDTQAALEPPVEVNEMGIGVSQQRALRPQGERDCETAAEGFHEAPASVGFPHLLQMWSEPSFATCPLERWSEPWRLQRRPECDRWMAARNVG